MLLGVLLFSSVPQHALSQSQQLETLDSALDKETLIGSLKWEALASEIEGERPILVSEAIGKVKNMSDEELHGYQSSPIVDALKEFELYCGERGYFLSGISPDSSKSSSAEFIRFFRKDGEIGILISKIFDDSVYNLKVTSHEERVKERINKCIVSKIKNASEKLGGLDIGYYGISHFYGAEDPSGYGSLGSEMVSVVVPESVASNFAEGSISDKEMINNSEVYVKSAKMTAEYIRTSVDL